VKKERKEIAINLLTTPEHNSRIHPEKQIKEIRRSLKKWGQYRDAVVDDHYMILAGNGLVEAMRAEGFKKAWVVIVYDVSENDKKKFMLADNKTTGLGIDDLNNIELLIAELDGDFDIPGFDDDILKSINAAAEEISEALDTYGIATAENIKGIETKSAINEQHEEEVKKETPENTEPETERKSIICPKCGEVIWL
jgi:ParB-like chromosome segregation protein Spo0J